MKPFSTQHEELIHDVSYDFYGKQIATCSSDQHIKIFDLDSNSNEWVLNDSWKAHHASIVKIDWSSPEFGKIIASISHDKTVKIWEEDLDEQRNSGRRWKHLATLNDSRGPLYDVAFAPSHLGLRLSTIGSDGVLRIYDAMEPADLRSWTLTSEVSVLSVPPASNLQSDFALAWCTSRFSPEKIVVCALDQGFIYHRNASGKLVQATTLPDHQGLIRDVAWAPSMGRFYQLLATACKDGKIRIFKLTERLTNNSNFKNQKKIINNDYNDEDDEEEDNESNVEIQVELISEHDDHHGETWSVSWNLTGTILSSSGDDGKIRLWKASYSNEFQCLSVISAEQKEIV
ncbi:putative WD repeat-containing protein [Wickerhamomyces ciferrii]|uniref:WD repeat-containing protein n=1 Tax=Wickerhamomyces ciferrii (strain ATCC 14091 / BCRC 22168 / CBS 111 / JCM 3599 / NBRC 0793 / NRRL Y-1031 F-60-10) TaxID=1206466 RepID=K0KXH2_WICCF|nr:putative WD repeat-containing protein [Wickerhamomyces ciferrii]CCH46179.1 putative WD repeat-containing protein [Wickerhamomyces ciferrii]